MAGYGASYGYGSGYGYGVTGFVGILDRLSVRPYSFWSFARRAAGYYSGPVGRIYRTSDGAEKDIYGRGSLGLVDPNEIAAFAPTGNALWTKLYDQTGAGRHFEQASNLIMPYACKSGVPVTENGLQSAEFVAADARRMAVASSQSAYTFIHSGSDAAISIVARMDDTAAIKTFLSNRGGVGFRISGTAAETISVEVHNGTAAAVSVSHGAGHTTRKLFIINVDADNATAAIREAAWANGVAQTGANAATGTPSTANAGDVLSLGIYAGANLYDGTISEVGIFQAQLTSEERAILDADAVETFGVS